MERTDYSFEEFVENFKAKLVKRYNWTVTNAAAYNNEEALMVEYKKGLSPQEAYYSIFDVEQDLQH